MDNVVSLVLASDAVRRQQAYDTLVKMFDSPDGSDTLSTFDDYSRLFDGICQWINSSSFKISINGLDLICKFSVKLGERMRQFVPQFASALFDRLGDNKEQVRLAAHDALAHLMETVCAAQFLFDLVPNVFQSKQPRIREEALLCLRNAMERYGGGGLSFQKLMPSITKLLDDPVPNVRDSAVQTLVLAYRIYGEKLRQDLSKRNLIPANKLASLQLKFDEVKDTPGANGENELFATTDTTDATTVSSVTSSGMSQSVIVMKRTGSSSSLSTGGPGRAAAPKIQAQVAAKKAFMTTSGAMTQSVSRGRDDGSVDEEIFRQAFEETAQVAQQVAHRFAFSTPREISDFMTRIRDIIPDTQVDWEKRIDTLRDFRFYVILDGANNEDFWTGLRNCEFAFQSAVRDLRSQLVRETCFTIAFLANQLGETGRMEHFAEAILPSLLGQIQNSARIMSSSAITCVQFVVSGVQSPRLIPIIAGLLAASRSAVIRKHCCEFIELALQQWPTNGCLDRQIPVLVESVKRGLSDADQEARASSRRAYWQLKSHFPNQTDVLFGQLDSTKQKYILADQPLNSVRTDSAIGQHGSRPPAPHTAVPLRSRSASRGRGGPMGSATSEDDISGASNGGIPSSANGRLLASHPPSSAMARRVGGGGPASGAVSPISGAPFSQPQQQQTLPPVPSVPSHIVSVAPSSMTTSVISGTGRALPRSLPFNTPTRTAGASPQTPTTPTMAAPTDSPGRLGGRSRIPVSQSQPGSRSQSPSPRAQYITSNIPINSSPGHLQANINIRVGGQDENRVRSASTISGQDDFTKQVSYRLGLAGLGYSSPASRGIGGGGSCVAGGTGDDNNSDAGSMCSDRSFGGMSRLSDRSAPPTVGRQFASTSSFAIVSGLSGRLFSVADVASGRGVCYGPLNVPNSGVRKKDYGALVNRLGSSAWEDRRAGLTELQAQLITGQLVTLNQPEIDRLTSVFTKLFNDPNKKVFALFLDVLVDFVMRFYPQLSGWLFIMLTRLFTRYGAGDLLESVQTRVLRCIDVARQCFPAEVQFSTVVRILLDQSQAQAIKAKVAVLNYLQQLATYSMDPSHLVDNDDTRLVLFRLVTWTCDVRSSDVRRAAQGVIIALFNLNSAEFSQILMKLQPKSQQMAMAILQSHMQSTSQQPQPLPPPPATTSASTTSTYLRRTSGSEVQSAPAEDITRVRELIRETTSDILNLSRLTSMNDPAESGTSITNNNNANSTNNRAQRPPIPPPTSHSTTPQPPTQSALPRPPYNPGIYQSSPSATATVPSTLPTQQSLIMNQLGALQSPIATDPSRRLAGAVAVLSSSTTQQSPRSGTTLHPPSLEEKQRALRDIAQLARQPGTEAAWQSEFKNVLFILSEILLAPMTNLDDVAMRSTALQTLERLALAMPSRFSEYVDFVVLRVLDGRGFQPLSEEGGSSGTSGGSEVANQQVRDVERCSMALASCLPAESLIRVLSPLIDRAEYPQNEQSIKMVTKAVERLDRTSLGPLLGSICPGLVRACEHTQSSVRKAAVFCLVSLYLVVGEQLRQHLTALSQVKTKLLNLYIERTVSQMAQAQARRDSSTRTANGSANGSHLPLSEANVS